MTPKTVVAIFEDDPVDLFLYEKIFERLADKMTCIYVRTLEEQSLLSGEVEFDMAIIDIHFWGNNVGLSILSKLRNTARKDFLAIAITPLLQEGDLELIMSAGFDLCVEKPVIFQQATNGPVGFPGI
jgi:CheY-like chemotaxis protein